MAATVFTGPQPRVFASVSGAHLVTGVGEWETPTLNRIKSVSEGCVRRSVYAFIYLSGLGFKGSCSCGCSKPIRSDPGTMAKKKYLWPRPFLTMSVLIDKV